jgi:hypothetical protein
MRERIRTAGNGAVLLVLVALGASAGIGQQADALDKLSMDDGLLTWDGIRLGMTIPQIERRVGATIAIQKSKQPGCPAFVAQAEHHGLSMTIGFTSPKPSGKADWISIRFEGHQIQSSGADLVASLKQKIAGVEWLPPAEPAGIPESDDLEPDYAVPGKEPQVVRFYPRESMLLAKKSCLG